MMLLPDFKKMFFFKNLTVTECDKNINSKYSPNN